MKWTGGNHQQPWTVFAWVVIALTMNAAKTLDWKMRPTAFDCITCCMCSTAAADMGQRHIGYLDKYTLLFHPHSIDVMHWCIRIVVLFFCFSLACIFFFAHSACLSRPFGIVLCFFAPLHPEFMYPTSANWIGTTLVGVCVWMPPYLHCAHVLCHKEQSVILCALTLSRLAYQQHKQHVRIYDKIVVDGENEAKGTRRREATNS